MDFASDYLYVPDNEAEDYEHFDDDLLSNKLHINDDEQELSDDESDAPAKLSRAAPQAAAAPMVLEAAAPAPAPKRLRKVRKANTNVCAVNLGSLASDLPVFTGDPLSCKNCSVYFTDSSKWAGDKLSGMHWICEYCGFDNMLLIEDPEEEIPKGTSIDYLLCPPKNTADSAQNDLVIFCIDISGSMCCTSEVRGEFKIRTDPALAASLAEFIERAPGGGLAEQHFPREERGLTYVSRLQCVQAAVADQIEKMAKLFPEKRVVIITFSNDVTVHLPGNVKHVITGDKLNNFDYLFNFRTQEALNLNTPVKDSEKEMLSTVLGLNEGGATALGPALLLAVGLGAEKRGSSVILCTDGIANIGLGSLEDLNEHNVEAHPSPLFYNRVAETALSVGTSVSVCSIKGTNARLEYIAKVSAETRGMNEVVDPLELGKNFNFILENAVIATDVSVQMFLHKSLKFRHEKSAKGGKKQASRLVGNCTKESCITFEYEVCDPSALETMLCIPFQIQITYSKPDGTKCLRVISKQEKVTKDREKSEQAVNVGVVGIHSAQQVAHYASEGNYGKARMLQKANMRMLNRGVKNNPEASNAQKEQLGFYTKEAVRLNTAIKKTKAKEISTGRGYNSADEDESSSGSEEDDFMPIEPPQISEEVDEKPKADKKASKPRARTNHMKSNRGAARGDDDEFSTALYSAQNPMYSAYM